LLTEHPLLAQQKSEIQIILPDLIFDFQFRFCQAIGEGFGLCPLTTRASNPSLQNFAADIGGLMGLFFGFSIISLIEIIYICVHRFGSKMVILRINQ
jgi:hypothetical protein